MKTWFVLFTLILLGTASWAEANSTKSLPAILCILLLCDEGKLISGKVLINEVSSTYYTNSERWVELVNVSDEPVTLSGIKLRSQAYNQATGVWEASREFVLPTIQLAAGGYAVLRADFGGGYGNEHIFYLKSGDVRPYWWASGFVELLDVNGGTADFVRFGDSTMDPTTVSAWAGGSAVAVPYGETEYGKSIARSLSSVDSNAPTDWVAREFSTFAGPNDVTCSNDDDGDGIPDCSELAGTTFNGLPLYDWGARQNQTDIFMHINYMDSADEGIVPHRLALDKFVGVMAGKGYSVHLDAGDIYDQSAGINPAEYDLGDGGTIPWELSVYLICSSTTSGRSAREHKAIHMDPRRQQVFYYALFGSSQNQDGSDSPSGCAETPGNDLIVTLGNWGLNSGNTVEQNYLVNFQASTLLHEFGHNLSFGHGGNEATNYKPNYFSVMNYLYQLPGLPAMSNPGDRWYRHQNYEDSSACYSSSLVNGPDTSNFVMDFSNGEFSDLVETALDESGGLGHIDYTNVDYNCDIDFLDTVDRDINYDGMKSALTDYDDWANVVLVYARSSYGTGLGARLPTTTDTPARTVFPVDARARDAATMSPFWNDVQYVTPETKPFDPRKREKIGRKKERE